MTERDNADGGRQNSESTMMPFSEGVAQLLLRWMSCPECGSSDAIKYRTYEEYQTPELANIQKEVHQIRCVDCGHGDEGHVRPEYHDH